MKIHQLRNATALITLGEHRLLLDPMFAEPGKLPGFKFFGGGRRRNPLVPLPPGTDALLEQATDILVTHEHIDHLDGAARHWIRQEGLPVWAGSIDVANLQKKGLHARPLEEGGLGLAVEEIPARHGRGLIGWLMGPVTGFYLAHPDEPSLYITSDAVLTHTLLETLDRLRPDLILAPAGSANFGLGSDILFSVDEMVELVKAAPGQVIFNHLESLDHCPTTRAGLRERMEAEGLGDRVLIPEDGEELVFGRPHEEPHARPRRSVPRKPGFQKWVASKL
jgi:L-ascorbate metabolism protein UlaG (beta-lactamase superfamily)